MIQIKNIKKSYGDHSVLDGITVDIHKGEVVAILGSSGSGKSTLLRCVNGLELASEGDIYVGKKKLEQSQMQAVRSQIGMVFQNFHLFSHMTVIKNLIYAPMQVQKLSYDLAYERAIQLLETVGLRDKENAFPHTLSGGQKQRIAIARALMMKPEVILFDEPTSALDPEKVGEVLKVIQRLASSGITILIVTHEMGFVREVSTRVLFLEKGKIIEDSKTSDFFNAHRNDRADRIAAFLNHPVSSR